jgi:hypothetical protein
MQKLKLQVEELAVESFTTAVGAEGMGTVQGHAETKNGCGTQTYETYCPDGCVPYESGGGRCYTVNDPECGPTHFMYATCDLGMCTAEPVTGQE